MAENSMLFCLWFHWTQRTTCLSLLALNCSFHIQIVKSPTFKMSNSSEKSWTHSKITTFKLMHTWKIDQFNNKIVPKNEKIVSSTFSAAGHSDLKFQLQLFPQSSRDDKYFELFLVCLPEKTIKEDFSVSCQFALLEKNASSPFMIEATYTKNSLSWGINNFDYSVVADPKNDYLHENRQLVVYCEFTVNYNQIQLESSLAIAESTESDYKANQKSLLDSGNFSDFKIVVDGTKIPIHKCILSAHSPVFDAMFSHNDTKEALENEVVIPDVTVEVMMDLLQYIYTGASPKPNRLSLELLALADKYQVNSLKSLCANHISTVLTLDNVVNAYLIADLHNASNLKANSLAFMASNLSSVLLTPGWSQLCETDGKKMAEVCQAIGNVLQPRVIA